jgi:hypothetical protein
VISFAFSKNAKVAGEETEKKKKNCCHFLQKKRCSEAGTHAKT